MQHFLDNEKQARVNAIADACFAQIIAAGLTTHEAQDVTRQIEYRIALITKPLDRRFENLNLREKQQIVAKIIESLDDRQKNAVEAFKELAATRYGNGELRVTLTFDEGAGSNQ